MEEGVGEGGRWKAADQRRLGGGGGRHRPAPWPHQPFSHRLAADAAAAAGRRAPFQRCEAMRWRARQGEAPPS